MAEKRQQFDDATVEVLMEIVEWWKAQKTEKELIKTELVPRFKRTKTATRSVRLDQALLEAAEKKARKDRARTGGNFNSLVEVLVWQYLGRPSKYVE